ncbi:MAG: DUF1501 domain-containing protein [Planctomycetota bacterium]|nr:DUF1501 domain-containing protein [Planctomycetota bacterium]MDA1214404.1 DUF1501 domain-containing protein [Planctomycetota bacterium]
MEHPRPPSKTSAGRREFLKASWTGFTSLSLANLYRLKALQAAETGEKERTAVILVWFRGGCSHLDTWDPKPNATAEYRGPFEPIATNVPGINITELLPRMAQIADKYSILRSVTHNGGGHPSGSLQVLAGDPDAGDKLVPKIPDWMSIAHYMRSDQRKMLPNYIAVNPVDRYDSFTIAGPTTLGASYEPFKIFGDPSSPDFKIPNLGLDTSQTADRFDSRLRLKQSFDRMHREIDQSGMMNAIDRFEGQALSLLTSPAAREAFDLTKEPIEVRERYGMHQWGQQCLMARRLVEAGVEIITTEFDGPLCGRVQNWDDHAVNQHVFDALKFRVPTVDQTLSALIEDIYDRGLDKRVLVIATGEFGRTPRISHVASSGGGVASAEAGVVQPGRDHWPGANSMIFAGGGIQTGQIIGATNAKGEYPVDRAVGPRDFLATIYRHLGIDYANATITDFAGRPRYILESGEAIPELIRHGLT